MVYTYLKLKRGPYTLTKGFTTLGFYTMYKPGLYTHSKFLGAFPEGLRLKRTKTRDFR